MSAVEALFFALGILTVLGGAGVVFLRNITYAALSLLVSLLAVAGLYLLLFADFLALVQILLYGGAIVIVLLFALMLTRLREFRGSMDNPQKPLAMVVALGILGVLIAALVKGVPNTPGGPKGVALPDLGQELFTRWAIPFEVASLVLLVALIGAIVIARPGGQE